MSETTERLDAIERRYDIAQRVLSHGSSSTISQLHRLSESANDVPHLLTIARKQAAALNAIAAVADVWEMNAGPGTRAAEVFGPQKVSVEFAVKSIRAALEPTP